MRIDIIVPAFNEFQNLMQLLPRWAKLETSRHGVKLRWLIIVEENYDRVLYESIRPDLMEIQFIARSGGSSYGAALRTGLGNISCAADAVLFMDADGSHDAAEILGMVAAFRHGFEIVVASRYVGDGRTDNPFILIWMSRALNTLFRVSIGTRVRDISNSFKLYKRELLEDLKIVSDNFEAVEEIFVFASQRSNNVLEIPTHFRSRLHGKSNRKWINFLATYFSFLRRLIRSKQ